MTVITPRDRVPEKMIVTQLVKKFPTFDRTRRLITVFTKQSPPLVPILRQMNPVYNLPPISLRSILILSSHLRPCLPTGFFPSGFQTKISYAFLSSLLCVLHAPHFILLDLITLITFCEAYKLWCSSLCNLLKSPATSSFLGPNILLSTLFSDTVMHSTGVGILSPT